MLRRSDVSSASKCIEGAELEKDYKTGRSVERAFRPVEGRYHSISKTNAVRFCVYQIHKRRRSGWQCQVMAVYLEPLVRPSYNSSQSDLLPSDPKQCLGRTSRSLRSQRLQELRHRFSKAQGNWEQTHSYQSHRSLNQQRGRRPNIASRQDYRLVEPRRFRRESNHG